MRFIRALLFFILAIVALIIGVLFSSRNSAPVPLDILIYQLPPMSIAIWILISFTLGALMSALVYGFINQQHKRQNRRLLSQVNRMQAVRGVAKQP